MLASATKITGHIGLIPRSGIQFVDFRLDAQVGGKKNWLFALTESSELQLLEQDDQDGSLFYWNASNEKKTVENETFDVSLTDMLAMFNGSWVPLPFFRSQPPDSFAAGPINWVRGRIISLDGMISDEADDDGSGHHLSVAFDTDLLPQIEGQPYLAPSSDDARAGREFRLVSAPRFLTEFATAQWVEEWLLELYRAMESKRRDAPIRTDDALFEIMDDRYGVECFHMAAYLAFLEFLKGGPADRPVVFSDIDSDADLTVIPVDLVIDLGNSRTCGIVIEADPNRGLTLNAATELEIRDLSRPELVYREPFDSRVEFHQVSFGKDNLSPLSGRSDAFMWPTIARVGQEASRLASLREGTMGDTGMSSPKRYLWDVAAREQPWRCNGRGPDQELEPYAKDGVFARHINREGKPRHKMAPDDPENLPPVEAKYSKSSLMTFAIAEIVMHAYRMINSPEYRHNIGEYPASRRLRSVIMTMPTAMTKPERELLKERAENAIDLVWLCLEKDEGSRPKLELNWDEASATQLVYLYTEVAKTFAGDARSFFEAIKRPYIKDPRPDVLRVASIDIGGGTTDLIITDYRVEGSGTTGTILPNQRFREGFNLAGDDILRNVIDKHVLSVIERAASEAGVATAGELMSELFGGDRDSTRKSESTLRQQFVTQVAIPIGLAILTEYERYDPLSGEDTRELTYAEIFQGKQEPPGRLLQFLENRIVERGGTDFVLREMIFPVEPTAIAATIRGVVNTAISAMCEAVGAYTCDVMLLSGRPSRLPAVLETVRAAMALPPDRIIPLNRYRVGQWYPFRDAAHRIKDPKTTAAVGAMIGTIARGRLPQFAFRSDLLQYRSTTRFIGSIDNEGRIRDEDVFYKNVNLDEEDYEFEGDGVTFSNTMKLGFRQLPIERWPATQMYALNFADDAAAERLRASTPLTVVLKRARGSARGGGESLDIDRVFDREGAEVASRRLSIKLQTMADEEGYWIDTGVLR